jgi:methylthioribulose-1-phosphate dehydratase
VIRLQDAADLLVEIGRRLDARGWVLGTSGNFSVVTSRDPLRMAITPSAASKGALTRDQILEIDAQGAVVPDSTGKPSAECSLHLRVAEICNAGAVLHTHSVWGTILSDVHACRGGLAIEGYEMLKGLEGVHTHKHREWIPILENDQEMTRLADRTRAILHEHPGAHAFLLRRHGLYTWGEDLPQAVRHVEILEFLFESIGRAAMMTPSC